jgi:hypothetical protein
VHVSTIFVWNLVMTTINRQQNNVVVSDSWSYSYCGYKTMPCDNAVSAVIFYFLLGG